ncbi:hypothetical protein [Nocardia otitidiscaviarum]|uniref:hypothetical protein n=1 Tax=Nocardia otitidiscaviarum TaxID=1823 RepID=UPI002453934A|nr:hypothetical protein [Nocardia otitidiscaviarum]
MSAALDRYAAVERRHRVQIIGGLRDAGLTYTQIRALLGVTLRQVETVLGEAETLRAQGFRTREIAAELGVPAGSLGRVLAPRRRDTITERQDQVLDALAHMHGMQVDVLAEFLNVGESTAYAIVRELIAKRLVCPLKKVQRGRAWVYLPRDVAARYLGWRPPDWTPGLALSEHYRAVAQARIMLVGSDPRLFVSERVLRHTATVTARAAADKRRRAAVGEFSTGRVPLPGRPHLHDGHFLGVVSGVHGWWALEVELSAKDPAYLDTAVQGAIRAAVDTGPYTLVGLLYLCRTKTVADAVEAATHRLPASLAALPLDLEIQDFDHAWNSFLARRTAARNAKARTAFALTQEPS